MVVTFFMMRTAIAALTARIETRYELHDHQKEGTVTSYFGGVNYLLETYATDYVITETDAYNT